MACVFINCNHLQIKSRLRSFIFLGFIEKHQTIRTKPKVKLKTQKQSPSKVLLEGVPRIGSDSVRIKQQCLSIYREILQAFNTPTIWTDLVLSETHEARTPLTKEKTDSEEVICSSQLQMEGGLCPSSIHKDLSVVLSFSGSKSQHTPKHPAVHSGNQDWLKGLMGARYPL